MRNQRRNVGSLIAAYLLSFQETIATSDDGILANRAKPLLRQNRKRPHNNRFLSEVGKGIRYIEDEAWHMEQHRMLEATSSPYEPIRIVFDSSALDNDVNFFRPLYATRIKALKDFVLPKVASLWEQALSVRRVEGAIRVQTDDCLGIFQNDIDPMFLTEGVPNGDLYVLVSARQLLGNQPFCSLDGVLAGANTCALGTLDRPTIGFINVCIEDLLTVVTENGRSFVTQESIEDTITVLMHELAHVLGFTSLLYPFFRSPVTGEPLTPRPFSLENVICSDGSIQNNIIRPSSVTTLGEGMSSNNKGTPYFEIITPTVTQLVRNHFDCQQLTGARLENQVTTPEDCYGSHWDEVRLYNFFCTNEKNLGFIMFPINSTPVYRVIKFLPPPYFFIAPFIFSIPSSIRDFS
eukprot:scaffold26915_cov71-Attheya_sp.AAC.9